MEPNTRFNIKTLCKVYNTDFDTMLKILMKCYLIDRNYNPLLASADKIIKEDDEYYITDKGLDILFESTTNLRVDRRCLTEKNEAVDAFLKHCINRAIASLETKESQIVELQEYKNKYDLLYNTLMSMKIMIDKVITSFFQNYHNNNWR